MENTKQKQDDNWKDELVNAITHGIGFLLSIPAMLYLIDLAANQSRIHLLSYVIFGGSMVFLYFCSTMLHSLFHTKKAKKIFQILDHSAIYLLIAGTYTPFGLITLKGTIGWALFATIWTLAIVGIIFKCFFIGRFKHLSTMFYLVMGWLIIIAIKPLYENLTPAGFGLLFTGGLMYTIGTIFYSFNKLPFSHGIWHLFVIAGNALMYFCVLLYV
ncbi:hemolysin III family protein [Caldibacillus lycopersici]|uniref:Hemolysin III family protein n=1 Tax=Perspicuibacillus lycopersici TaxID=1325689 RepID=A0AAE3IZV0_9BACI|nr:hemolysin III family protein [Perspicuibacillus lycopersici]MCU9615090.1 hemolysin III family protein [Perspicuibacillus lycopersici]